MKKWFVIVSSLIVVCILTFCVTVYVIAREPLNSIIEEGESVAKEEFQLKSIEDSYVYNGSQSYTVVIGNTAEEEPRVAFLPMEAEGEMDTRLVDEGISKDEVLDMLYKEDAPSKIVSAKIGYESVGPIWEIIYLDQEKTFNYYYVYFDNGELWRTIPNF